MPRIITVGNLRHPRRIRRLTPSRKLSRWRADETDTDDRRNIAHLGGTILGTSNYGNPFKLRVLQPDGSFMEIDHSDEVVRRFRERRLDALISVGGDGSLSIARDLHKKGLRVIGVPKTIDNDLNPR